MDKPKIRRSRHGCHNCKRQKIKCDEQKPRCAYCVKMDLPCDYSMKLTWGGRPYKNAEKRAQLRTQLHTPLVEERPAKRMTQESGTAAAAGTAAPTAADSLILHIHPFVVGHDGTPPGGLAAGGALNSTQEEAVLSMAAEGHGAGERGAAGAALLDRGLMEQFPGISDGIELLSHALESIASGGNQFSIKNSDIFNTFVTSFDPQDGARAHAFLPPAGPWPLSPPVEIAAAVSDTRLTSDAAALDALEARAPLGARGFADSLLSVPYYRELLRFWVEVASDHLVPAPSSLYQENPFKVILPRMAMDSPSILTTILAFAATVRLQYVSAFGDSRAVVDRLLARSCTELLKLLQDKATATLDTTLATVLLMACLEVFGLGNYDRHRAHTLGARQIIILRGLRLPTTTRGESQSEEVSDAPLTPDLVAMSLFEPSTTSESDVAYFLMRWFAYVDVIGALSATKNLENYLCHKLENLYHDTAYVELEKSGRIDRLLGFDVVFLPLLADIALLIRANAAGGFDAIPVSVVTAALELQAKMTRAFALGERQRQARLERLLGQRSLSADGLPAVDVAVILERDTVLRSTNRIFFNMGLLNLLRRVLRTPRLLALVQELCEEIGDLLQRHIEPRLPAEVCLIFCTFCAACETLNPALQLVFHARFTQLLEMGLTSARPLLRIIERCWATGKDWMSVATELDIDITLL